MPMLPTRSPWLWSCTLHATVIGVVVLGVAGGKSARRPAVHVLPTIERPQQAPEVALPAVESEPEPPDLAVLVADSEPPIELPLEPTEFPWAPAEPTPIDGNPSWPTRDARLDLTVVRLARPVSPQVPEAVAPPPAPDSPPTTVLTVVPGTNQPPTYPLVARRSGWQGTVLLRVRCDVGGGVIAVEIVRSSGRSVLDEAALAAVQRWQFEGGPGELEVPIDFRLRTDPW